MIDPHFEEWKALINDYLDGLLDEAGVKDLEDRLRLDPEARHLFVRFSRLHTDLHLETRARLAAERALKQIETGKTAARPTGKRFPTRVLLTAAGLLLAVAAVGWLGHGWFFPAAKAESVPTLAAIVNAQDCTWAVGEGPETALAAGRTLTVKRGLAELLFVGGTRVLLEGPTQVQLISIRGARLLSGKAVVKVPAGAAAFEVAVPRGKIWGTRAEFGVAVDDEGMADVALFQGFIDLENTALQTGLRLDQTHFARLDGEGVAVRATGGPTFTRSIVVPPRIVPRTLRLTFDHEVPGTLRDRDGRGTGLTHRLPGTGTHLPVLDPHLRLVLEKAHLELTATDSDVNRQFKITQGEYLGVRLSDLGFTGPEDFAVTATIPDIPALGFIGQFGLYAGVASNANIRGGLLNTKPNEPAPFTQFLVNNHGGPRSADSDLYLVGLLSTGTDLRMTLKRVGGQFALTVDNLSAGCASTLTIRHPEFLDGERDIYVGLFGATPRGGAIKPLIVKDFQATVWTTSSP